MLTQYKNKEREKNGITLIEEVNNIVNKIETERIYSSIYLGEKRVTTKNQVDSFRKLVDQEIEETIFFLQNNANNMETIALLSKITIELREIREGIDSNNKEAYQVTLFQHYGEKLIQPLNKIIQKISKRLQENYSVEARIFNQLIDIKNNLNQETSFIAYLLSHSKKMEIEELLLWEKMLNHDNIPDFQTIERVEMLKELYNTIKPLYFSNIKNDARAEIFNHALTGSYTLSIEKWISVSKSKIDKINVAQKILFIKAKTSLTKEIEKDKELILKMSLLALFFLLLTLMLLYLSYNLRKNSLYLTETLKEIEEELNEKQKLEIQEVIRKNDTIEIYKFLANAIKEPSREKENFLANMSHEIRTPLNGIIGFTNLLKAEGLEAEPLEFVNIIEESSNNLLNIVNDILDFAKVSSGKIELENIPFNIMEKFEACVDSYAIKASQKNIELGLFIDPKLPTEIVGDPTKISQVLLNLLSNAIKFTPEKGQINIAIEKLSETAQDIEVQFSVKDSGIGIPKEQRDKIFDAFSQADASTNRKFGGTGLGLTISSKFVELMHGKLQIRSIENRGTTFFFILKLKRSPNAKPQPKIREKNLSVGYITKDSLLTNDVETNVRHYMHYLGINFRTYQSDQIKLFQIQKTPDILFINDQYIPNREVMNRFLKVDTKIVLITTPNKQEYLESDKKRIEKIIYKPLNFSKILQTIEQCTKREKRETLREDKPPTIFPNMKILVAEDNRINQKLILNILKNLKAEITLASNGQEAVELFQKNYYDILLMDIEMPIMTGIQATSLILEYEKSRQQPHTPIIALTANRSQKEREKYLEKGMDGYLEKPLNLTALKETLAKYFLPKKSRMEFKNHSVLLYKETKVSRKIYQAILNSLGYQVAVAHSEKEFIQNISTQNYTFVLFDAKPLTNKAMEKSQQNIVKLIKERGAVPFAFSEEEAYQKLCQTLKERSNAQELQSLLKECKLF